MSRDRGDPSGAAGSGQYAEDALAEAPVRTIQAVDPVGARDPRSTGAAGPVLMLPPTNWTVDDFAHRPMLFFAGARRVAAAPGPEVMVTRSRRAVAFSVVTATVPLSLVVDGASSRIS